MNKRKLWDDPYFGACVIVSLFPAMIILFGLSVWVALYFFPIH